MAGNFNLAKLPPEVLEHILSFLDGRSVITLQSISRETQAIVDEALSGKIGHKFWLRRCFLELPRVLLLKALASFQTISGEQLKGGYHHLDPGREQLLGKKWRRIFIFLRQVRRKFRGPIQVKRLIRVQSSLKNEVTIAFYKRNTSATNPFRMESTSGSILFHAQCPCTSREDQAHLYFFDGMSTYRRGIQLVAGREKILSIHTVFLPLGPKSSSLDPAHLKVPVICVVLLADHVLLAHMYHGKAIQVSLPLSDQHRNFPNLPTEIRFGIWGNCLGVWLDPDTIVIYKMCIDPTTGNMRLESIKHIVMRGLLHSFWINVSAQPSAYLPVLRNNFQNPFKSSLRPFTIPTFSLLSPTLESFTVHDNGVTNDMNPWETEGRVEIFRPKLTPDNTFAGNLDIGQFTRGKSEQNVVFFFNSTWIAVLFTNEIWIYQNLVPKLFAADKAEELLDMECQTDNFFILGTNQHIYLTLFEYIPPTPINYQSRIHWARGQIEFEVIRKIPLAPLLPDPRLTLVHCHLDMDRGNPYIFLSLDVPLEERTAYTFELMKMTFESTEEELEEEFGHLKDEDPLASNEFAPPISLDMVTDEERIKNPKLDALFKTFGIK